MTSLYPCPATKCRALPTYKVTSTSDSGDLSWKYLSRLFDR